MKSYWVEKTTRPSFLNLQEDIEADVCIIGAGITGIVTGYMLLETGLKICIIDKGEICSGVTENTTAKITSQHNLIYSYLIQSFGEEFAKKYFKANEEAIDLIEKIVTKEKIDCEFIRTNNYIYTCKEEYVQKIKDEVNVLESIGGTPKLVNKIDLPFEIKIGIEMQNQAQFHPLKYLYKIAEVLKEYKLFILMVMIFIKLLLKYK